MSNTKEKLSVQAQLQGATEGFDHIFNDDIAQAKTTCEASFVLGFFVL